MDRFIQEDSKLPKRFLETITQASERIYNAQIDDLVDLILFGSCAAGKVKTGSDVDLCIVTKESITKRGFRSELEEKMEGLPCSVDLVFYRLSDMDSTDTFTRNLMKTGKSLLGGINHE